MANSFHRWFRVDKAYYCVPPKCGGSAFYLWMTLQAGMTVPERWLRTAATAINPPLSITKIGEGKGKKFLAIREPVDRFYSLWRSKCRDGDHAVNQAWMKGLSMDELLDHIEQYPFGNAHWAPLYLWLVPGCRLIHYKDLGKILKYDLKVNTSNIQNSDPEVPIDRVKQLYQRDVDLWRRMNGKV